MGPFLLRIPRSVDIQATSLARHHQSFYRPRHGEKEFCEFCIFLILRSSQQHSLRIVLRTFVFLAMPVSISKALPYGLSSFAITIVSELQGIAGPRDKIDILLFLEQVVVVW